MIHLISSIVFFCLFLITHVVWFRVRPPKLQLHALLLLGSIWLAIYLASLIVFPGLYQLGVSHEHSPFGVPLVLTSAVIYTLLCLCYVIVYSGVEVESPSAKIMLLIYQRGKMSYAELREIFTNERLVLPRLGDLVSGGSVAFDGVHYRLGPRGAMVARVFEVYRRLLRQGLGG